MKIVFMGTPDFAAASLAALLKRPDCEVAAAFTQPDRPKGRGHKLSEPPVKLAAKQAGVAVYQPETLKDGGAAAVLKEICPDLIVVAAYGKILPKEILTLPRFGCINVHGSLLPRYRGAAPIQWAVLNGERETGVTTMQMAEGLDTGDILLMKKTEIGPDETASGLYDRLAALGAAALTETIDRLEAGTLAPRPQDDAQASYAPMLSKALCEIDFDRDAALVHNQIRGLSEWPCARTTANGAPLKVYASRVVKGVNAPPGTVTEQKRFVVACKTDGVELVTVQAQGGRRMDGRAFLNGRKVLKLGD